MNTFSQIHPNIQATRVLRVELVGDIICPWCYVAKRRFERALATLDDDICVELKWHPFILNRDMPRDGMDRQTYMKMKFGGLDQAREVYGDVIKAALSENINLRLDLIEHTPNTVDVHRVILWAQRQGLQDLMTELLFVAFFEEGRNIGDRHTLVELAESAGMDGYQIANWLNTDLDEDLVYTLDDVVRGTGIRGVPCFIFNGRYTIPGAQDFAIFKEVLNVAVNTPI